MKRFEMTAEARGLHDANSYLADAIICGTREKDLSKVIIALAKAKVAIEKALRQTDLEYKAAFPKTKLATDYELQMIIGGFLGAR